MGMLLQFTLTFIVTLVLAFKRSPTLTLVILSSIPLMVIVQFLTQVFSFRFLTAERNSTANASTTIDRAIASIATVKAFNAHTFEEARANYAINEIKRAARSCAAVWGISTGSSRFIMFGMLVQGFWYGSKLVQPWRCSRCLLADDHSSYTHGKSTMASLMALINPPHDQPRLPNGTHHPIAIDTPKSLFSLTHKFSHHKPIPLQKINPANCKGAFGLYKPNASEILFDE